MDFKSYKQEVKELFFKDKEIKMTEELWEKSMNKFAKEMQEAYDKQIPVKEIAQELLFGIMFMNF